MLKNMKKSTKSNVITLGIVVGFYVLIQILSAAGALTNSFSGQLVPICAYVIKAVSLNLTVGMLGELSLGHAGFMSVGAFSGTLVYVVMSENAPQPLALLLAFVVGGAVAGLFGVLVGIPVLRLSGDYLAIVTLAFGEIVKNVMNACYLGVDSHGLHFSLKDSASLNLGVDGKVLINGAMGITGIKKASTFSTPPAFTTPSRRMRSSNNSTETSLGFGAIFAYRTILGDRAPLGNDCRKHP
mgnify:CR=1 FL=1